MHRISSTTPPGCRSKAGGQCAGHLTECNTASLCPRLSNSRSARSLNEYPSRGHTSFSEHQDGKTTIFGSICISLQFQKHFGGSVLLARAALPTQTSICASSIKVPASCFCATGAAAAGAAQADQPATSPTITTIVRQPGGQVTTGTYTSGPGASAQAGSRVSGTGEPIGLLRQQDQIIFSCGSAHVHLT